MSIAVNSPSIKAIAFDWGGVLCEDPAPGFLELLTLRLQCSKEDLQPHLSAAMDGFQRGILSEERFLAEVAEKVQRPVMTRPFWKEALKAVYREQPAILHIARGLRKQGYAIGLLTNTEAPAREFHLECGYGFFDARIFSCVEGLVKPERKIYALMAKRLGVTTDALLLIDDKKENIDGAKAAGAFGILYENPAQLVTQLGSHGIHLAGTLV
jgi:epoxide hydrolase-like predicted phosphatase